MRIGQAKHFARALVLLGIAAVPAVAQTRFELPRTISFVAVEPETAAIGSTAVADAFTPPVPRSSTPAFKVAGGWHMLFDTSEHAPKGFFVAVNSGGSVGVAAEMDLTMIGPVKIMSLLGGVRFGSKGFGQIMGGLFHVTAGGNAGNGLAVEAGAGVDIMGGGKAGVRLQGNGLLVHVPGGWLYGFTLEVGIVLGAGGK